jgi:hypothetical protein
MKRRSVCRFGTDVLESAKQVSEQTVGFVLEGAAKAGHILELNVDGVAGMDAAVVVVGIELDFGDILRYLRMVGRQTLRQTLRGTKLLCIGACPVKCAMTSAASDCEVKGVAAKGVWPQRSIGITNGSSRRIISANDDRSVPSPSRRPASRGCTNTGRGTRAPPSIAGTRQQLIPRRSRHLSTGSTSPASLAYYLNKGCGCCRHRPCTGRCSPPPPAR